jgi:hypothetical protein
MSLFSRFLFLGALLAAPAAAQQGSAPISLVPGETVTVMVDDGERANVTARGPAPPLNAFQRELVRAYHDGAYDQAIGPVSVPVRGSDTVAQPPPVARGEIRITFLALDGGRVSWLTIENGYGRALSYRAVMHRDARSARTDVCQVRPGLRGFEWWPHPIARLELSQLRLVPWVEGRPPLCE